MATMADVIGRIDLNLRSINAEADFLPQLAVQWETESDSNRYVWYVEWRDLMSRLEELDRANQANVMSPEQRARYMNLLSKLRAAAPTLQCLDLPLPTVVLTP